MSSTMSKDRWEEITKFHLVYYTQIDVQDNINKIRPFLEHLRSKLKEVPMTEYLCVDEQLAPFQGEFIYEAIHSHEAS